MPACRAGNHEKGLAFSHMDKACPMVSQVAPAHAAHVLQENVEKLKETAKELNPRAKVVVTDSLVTVDNADTIRGKKVVLVEDGPTLTHGGMPYGAGESLHHAWARLRVGLFRTLVADKYPLRSG